MPETFDPYHLWLGIPPKKQPPNRYTLLGLDLFESNPDVIESTADQRMAHLRTFQSGKHGELSQRLLNEVAAARVCLLDPAEKAVYDKQLRDKLATQGGKAAKLPVAKPIEPQPANTPAITPQIRPTAHAATADKNDRKKLGLILGAVAVGGVLVVVMVWALNRGGNSNDLATNHDVSERTGPVEPTTTPAAPSEPSSPAAGQPESSDSPAAETERPKTGPDAPATGIPSDDSIPVAAPPDDSVEPGSSPTEPRPSETPPPEPDSLPDTSSSARLPLPAKEAQDRVLRQLDELYDFDVKTREERLKLANELLRLGGEANAPPERFVLVRKSMEVAAEAGDAALMLKTVDTIAAEFEIDPVKVKQRMVLSFARDATDEESIGSLVDTGMAVVDEALSQNRYDDAFAIINATYAACRRPAGRNYLKQVYDRRNELADLNQAWQKFREALGTLDSDPENAAAHLTAGRWYCFRCADWDRGLAHLAQGNDDALRAAAEQEIAAPPDPTAQVTLADAWWDLAEKCDDESKTVLQRRAGHWYRQALPRVESVLLKQKATQRIEEIEQATRLASAADSSDDTPTRQPAPTDVAGTERPSRRMVQQAKSGIWVKVFAAGNNNNEVYFNGRHLMKCDRKGPSSVVGVLKEGDVLAVKLGDRFDIMSHWMMFLNQEGEYLFETSDKWIAYLPVDHSRWGDVRNIQPHSQPAEYVNDRLPYVDLVKSAAERAVPNYPKSQPICSTLNGPNKRGDSYLYYVVTVEDLIPKKPAAEKEPSPPDGTGIVQLTPSEGSGPPIQPPKAATDPPPVEPPPVEPPPVEPPPVEPLADESETLEKRAEALDTAARSVRTPEERQTLCREALVLAEDAIHAEDYERAKELRLLATSLAKGTRDRDLIDGTSTRSRELVKLEETCRAAQVAFDKLDTDPDDPAANLEAGKFHCLVNDDWKTGLPMLAKGSDNTLKDLAARDLAGTTSVDARVQLGDDWWTLSRRERGFQNRAGHHYELAFPEASVRTRTRLEMRLQEIAEQSSSLGGLAANAVVMFTFERSTYDERDGKKRVNDLSRNQRSGELRGRTTPSPGKAGSGIRFFDSEDVVSVGGDYPIGNAPRTLSAWFRLDRPAKGNIVRHGSTKEGAARVVFELAVSQEYWYVELYNTRLATKVRPDGNWHHHCAVFDGNVLSYFIDTVLVGRKLVVLQTRPGGMTLGPAPGVLDEVVLFDRAVNDKEVLKLYQLGRSGRCLKK